MWASTRTGLRPHASTLGKDDDPVLEMLQRCAKGQVAGSETVRLVVGVVPRHDVPQALGPALRPWIGDRLGARRRRPRAAHLLVHEVVAVVALGFGRRRHVGTPRAGWSPVSGDASRRQGAWQGPLSASPRRP